LPQNQLMKLYLVRQAETLGNKEGRYGGYEPSLSGFTERGKKQLAQLKEFFLDKEIYEVFCSPKNACYQTSQKIKTYLFATVMQLEDIQTGLFAGLNKEEIQEKFSAEVEKRAENKYEYSFPRGESFKECEERVIRWFSTIHLEPDKEYCVVTHLAPILLILKHITGKSFDEIKNTFIAPGSLTILHKEGDKWIVDEINKELVDASDLKERMSSFHN